MSAIVDRPLANNPGQSKQQMPLHPATPTASQGLPSPPPRSPATPSASFPYTLTPRLPKVGTAKLRLRSNVIGLLAFTIVWWQHSLHSATKSSISWLFGSMFGDDSVLWAIGSLGITASIFSSTPATASTDTDSDFPFCREHFVFCAR